MNLDPRVNLIFLMICTTMAFSVSGIQAGLLLYGVVLLKAIWARQWGLSITISFVYMLLYCACESIALPILLTSMIRFFFLRGITIAFAYASFFRATDIAETITALEHMHVPHSITICIAILLRFLPSIHQDFLYIKQGMKTRGIKLGFMQAIKKPAQTYVALLVPILMRIIKTSSELAASSETRGIMVSGTKSDYQDVRLNSLDYVGFLIFSFLFIGVILTSIYR